FSQTSITVGAAGFQNSLLISNAGLVFIGDPNGPAVDGCIIGQTAAATENAIALGANSYFQVNGLLMVGADGGANQLDVDDGSAVNALGCFVGLSSLSHDNSVSVKRSLSPPLWGLRSMELTVGAG